MLNRHVNSHFPENGGSSKLTNGESGHGARKSIEGGGNSRLLKRAGLKLKRREVLFSARIFDFFDAGIMAGVRHAVADTQRGAAGLGIAADGSSMTFAAKALVIRRVDEDCKEVLVRWEPENL